MRLSKSKVKADKVNKERGKVMALMNMIGKARVKYLAKNVRIERVRLNRVYVKERSPKKSTRVNLQVATH
jgi:hypothetical protein